jgi:hypothetical protein
VKPEEVDAVIKIKNSSNIVVDNAVFYANEWGKSPSNLPGIIHTQTGVAGYPSKAMK